MLLTKLINCVVSNGNFPQLCPFGLQKYQELRWSHIAHILFALFVRIISIIFFQGHTTEVDDVCAALALMYGYAASYAPSTAIEARIETLVVSLVYILSIRIAQFDYEIILSFM